MRIRILERPANVSPANFFGIDLIGGLYVKHFFVINAYLGSIKMCLNISSKTIVL